MDPAHGSRHKSLATVAGPASIGQTAQWVQIAQARCLAQHGCSIGQALEVALPDTASFVAISRLCSNAHLNDLSPRHLGIDLSAWTRHAASAARDQAEPRDAGPARATSVRRVHPKSGRRAQSGPVAFGRRRQCGPRAGSTCRLFQPRTSAEGHWQTGSSSRPRPAVMVRRGIVIGGQQSSRVSDIAQRYDTGHRFQPNTCFGSFLHCLTAKRREQADSQRHGVQSPRRSPTPSMRCCGHHQVGAQPRSTGRNCLPEKTWLEGRLAAPKCR